MPALDVTTDPVEWAELFEQRLSRDFTTYVLATLESAPTRRRAWVQLDVIPEFRKLVLAGLFRVKVSRNVMNRRCHQARLDGLRSRENRQLSAEEIQLRADANKALRKRMSDAWKALNQRMEEYRYFLRFCWNPVTEAFLWWPRDTESRKAVELGLRNAIPGRPVEFWRPNLNRPLFVALQTVPFNVGLAALKKYLGPRQEVATFDMVTSYIRAVVSNRELRHSHILEEAAKQASRQAGQEPAAKPASAPAHTGPSRAVPKPQAQVGEAAAPKPPAANAKKPATAAPSAQAGEAATAKPAAVEAPATVGEAAARKPQRQMPRNPRNGSSIRTGGRGSSPRCSGRVQGKTSDPGGTGSGGCGRNGRNNRGDDSCRRAGGTTEGRARGGTKEGPEVLH